MIQKERERVSSLKIWEKGVKGQKAARSKILSNFKDADKDQEQDDSDNM